MDELYRSSCSQKYFSTMTALRYENLRTQQGKSMRGIHFVSNLAKLNIFIYIFAELSIFFH